MTGQRGAAGVDEQAYVPEGGVARFHLEGPGGRLALVDAGPTDAAKAPLVLVHGWGADTHDWDAVVARFAPERRVLAVDLRGHGGSAPNDDHRPHASAADVAFVLGERAVAGPVILVGHSLGAVVASILAVERPVPIAGLMVIDPAYGRPAGHHLRVEPWVRRLRAGDAAFGAELVAGSVDAERHPRLREYLFRRALRTPVRTIWRTLADLHLSEGALSTEPAGSRYLVERACPVLALNRDRERARWEAGVLAASANRGPVRSRSLVWPDSGHFPHLEHPDRFHTLLERWVGLLAGAPADTFGFEEDVVDPVSADGGTADA
ncbi:alpha/beta fold hydrolase [Embleya hyalina]|uniref:alpha/beta fold hydrolase n=1 Tax=Embleya hyalina TaxID=516124 RepID=UPI00135BF39A|nr:alpha/beta hydrolase [Embleya hyalina]